MTQRMYFSPACCPECGEAPEGQLDNLQALARLVPEGDGYQWEGSTEVWWDSQKPVLSGGLRILLCGSGHEWRAEVQSGVVNPC